MNKYELTDTSKTYMCERVYQIRALRDFDNVKVGQLGGFIAGEDNLSQVGNCWVDNQAIVCGSGRVMCNAWACEDSIVSEGATLLDDACIFDRVHIKGSCRVKGSVQLYGSVKVGGGVILSGDLRFDCGRVLADHLKNEFERRNK